MKKYEEYIDLIEKLYEENNPKEAERVLIEGVDEANEANDMGLKLQLLNELIGYYRQTSEKEKLIAIIEAALLTAKGLGLKDSTNGRIVYATTALNAATGYRSIGELDKSEKYYELTLNMYENSLNPNDMLYAGLYNNMSLLKQEKGEFAQALEYQKKALNIALLNNAGFEIAVTYANLANTAVILAGSVSDDVADKYDKAKEYAYEAIKRFEERSTIDPHYCAALSALGICLFNEKNYAKAASMFKRAMAIVEKSFGQNSQYFRLKENYDMCIEKCVNGLKLSKMYYEEIGRPMLKEKFGQYIDKMAIGLSGEGSDCYGFDDDASMDHDWGPEFCIWISKALYEEIGEKLTEEYNKLPKEFMGYSRTSSGKARGRRGVICTEDYYDRHLGAHDYESLDFRAIPDYKLSLVTNGEVFADPSGDFSKLRNELKKGYPESILYLKLAEDFAKISQTGQYNFARMLNRNDRLTANMMLADCIKQIMIVAHHMNNLYPMHDKWLHRSFESIAAGSDIDLLLKKLNASFALSDSDALKNVPETVEQICGILAKELYDRDIISDISSYLDDHTDELVKKAEYSLLSTDELVRKVAKTEFEAFDKVKNEGGRASCQNDWPTFSIMRRSQYLTWNRSMLLQYLYDFNREMSLGHNLITEKYGRMMESTAKEKYEKIKDNFEVLSEEKKRVIEQIVAIQMDMVEAFGKNHPLLASNARSFHTYEDNMNNTSYETYLRGEISTYSDKMLQLYGRFVVNCLQNGINIAEETIKNTGKLYGYSSLEAFEGKS